MTVPHFRILPDRSSRDGDALIAHEPPATWDCYCGQETPEWRSHCQQCSAARGTWQCGCGHCNPKEARECEDCGVRKPKDG